MQTQMETFHKFWSIGLFVADIGEINWDQSLQLTWNSFAKKTQFISGSGNKYLHFQRKLQLAYCYMTYVLDNT